MENLFSLLNQLGLDQKEIAVYLACLKNPTSNPTKIARDTSLKRTTVYIYLEKLVSKGLLGYKIKGRRRTLVTAPLRNALIKRINDQKAILAKQENLIAKLPIDKMVELEVQHTNVYYYEGKDGVRTVLDQILQKNLDFYWIGSLETLFQVINAEEFYRTFTLPRMKQRTSLKALVDSSIKKHKRFNEELGIFRSFRFFDKKIETPALLILFKNTICLISVQNKKARTVVIQDRYMFEMVRLLFDAYWEKASLQAT